MQPGGCNWSKQYSLLSQSSKDQLRELAAQNSKNSQAPLSGRDLERVRNKCIAKLSTAVNMMHSEDFELFVYYFGKKKLDGKWICKGFI